MFQEGKRTSKAAGEKEKIINLISGSMSPPFANIVVLNVLGRGASGFFVCLFFFFFF